MILIDMSNLSFMTVLEYHARTKEDITDELMRHLILTKLLHTKKLLDKHSKDKKVLLAFDSKEYWRKKFFPLYKFSRKQHRKDSKFDWDSFFPMYNKFKEELQEYFPYISLEVLGAEADDIFYVISELRKGRDCIIGSSDEDCLQLQIFWNEVQQYSLKNKKFITVESQNYDLFDHVVGGDIGDGIPNILSDTDTFTIDEKRQRTLTAKRKNEWKDSGLIESLEFCDDAMIMDRYLQNKKLIDMREIPDEIRQSIIDKYNSYEATHGRIFEFCKKYKLTKLMTNF